MKGNKMIRTPRKGARVGDKEYIAGQPVAHIVFKQSVTKNKKDNCVLDIKDTFA